MRDSLEVIIESYGWTDRANSGLIGRAKRRLQELHRVWDAVDLSDREKVWYQPDPEGQRYSGVTRGRVWRVGGVPVITLAEMDEDYQRDFKRDAVPAAQLGCIERRRKK